jgi:hypothetical protein
MYIADLPAYLEQFGVEGVQLGEMIVRVLLYADDSALVARSASDLQRALDALQSYCAEWRLHVNVPKTKVMVFHQQFARRHAERDVVFQYNCINIERVTSFKYLGVYVCEGFGLRKYRECVKYRLEQAKRALAIWRRRCHLWFLDPLIAVRLFRTCVAPVLEYGIGLWRPGNFTGTGWKEIEKFWRGAARSIVGVPLRTPCAAIMGDLGWRPFWTRAAWYVVNMWTRVTRMADSDIPRQAMAVQRQLMDAKQPCWLAGCAEVVQLCDSGREFWKQWFESPTFNVPCCVRVQGERGREVVVKWEDILKTEFEQVADEQWGQEVCGDAVGPGTTKKLRTYKRFKSVVLMESYLTRVRNRDKRGLLAMLRMGVAPLRVETGRYERVDAQHAAGIPFEQRVCLVCGSGCVETEEHFVMECPAYACLRKRLMKVCSTVKPLHSVVQAFWHARRYPGDDFNRQRSECFDAIMAHGDVCCHVANFVFDAFRVRALKLEANGGLVEPAVGT